MKKIQIYRDPQALQRTQKFGKKNLKGKICLSPFVVADIDLFGNVRLCNCASWLPTMVGNIMDQPLIEILKNQTSQDIRQSILNGTYEYCNEKVCGVLASNQLNNYESVKDIVDADVDLPTEIVLAGDLTCNLSCPSCREKVFSFNDEDVAEMNQVGERIAANLFSKPTTKPIFLTLSTSGELFASPTMLNFLSNINKNDYPNLALRIQTNGLLAERRWDAVEGFNIDRIIVTVDATTKSVYEKLRRGGKWEKILKSLEFIQSKKSLHNFKLHTRMVVQADNYMQMEDFYHMSLKYNADCVEYTRILPWGHLQNPQQFLKMDVANPKNVCYNSYVSCLEKVKSLPNTSFFGGI